MSLRFVQDLEYSSLRQNMNKLNTAFGEDTQRGTDRLIRNALQDLTELQREGQIKDGKSRAESKVAIVDKRLSALENTLGQLLAFLPESKL